MRATAELARWIIFFWMTDSGEKFSIVQFFQTMETINAPKKRDCKYSLQSPSYYNSFFTSENIL